VRAKLGWRKRSGRVGEQVARDHGTASGDLGVDRDLLERAAPAYAARRRRVEAPPRGIAGQRPGDLDDVVGEVLGEARPAHAVDQALAEQEAERELLVVPGRAHGDRQRLAVDPDLHRLLDGHLVAPAVAFDGGRSCARPSGRRG
jgi:hypothetical protein